MLPKLTEMDKRTFKDEAYGEIARMAKAMANPGRLEIIDFIANGEKCVEDIALQTGMTMANASQHLQRLKRERLVMTRKVGVQVYYRLASGAVYDSWQLLRDQALALSPHLRAALEQLRRTNAYPPPVTLEELRARTDVHLLDVRPRDEYRHGHLPEATSIPLAELAQRCGDLPRDKLIVAYCRGMFCTLADEAVKVLQAQGYQARKVEVSVPEYEAASS